MLPESYNRPLVLLSFVVAAFGSFVALSMAERLPSLAGKLRPKWLVGAAFAQGTGIWGMHFTGMLALRLPVAVSYDVALVAFSWAVAFAGSILALRLTHRRALSRPLLGAGGFAIGAGIFGLHFIDMAAMTMHADPAYSPGVVAASAIIAVFFGLFSLWSSREMARKEGTRRRPGQLVSALVMAVAITGQHYTGMAAADFHPAAVARSATGPTFPSSSLPAAVLTATFAILTAALAGATVARGIRSRAIISQRLLTAQEDERRRIARVLHEDVGQLLTAIRLNLQRLRGEEGDHRIVDDSTHLVDEALQRVRMLALELRPSVLDDLGLVAAVTWFANRTAERAGFEVKVQESLGGMRLSELTETATFRIVAQALMNISRHAQAKQVRVSLRRVDERVDVEVTDDGKGFDVAAARARADAGESLGLIGMNELATLAGGVLTVRSKADSGTTVHVRFTVSGH